MSTLVAQTRPTPRVLADLALPSSRARELVLVLAAVVLTAGCAQLTLPLPGSPVPITGQTFAVLGCGAVLGARRGALAMAVYVALGVVGLPVYADGAHGPAVVFGATGGYLVGFMLAALLVGRLAELRLDRSPVGMLPLYAVGTAVIYAVGVPWLAVATGMTAGQAIAAGLTPFLLGDAVKALVAAALLPAAWKAASRGA